MLRIDEGCVFSSQLANLDFDTIPAFEVRPWDDKPFGVVSLREMLEDKAEAYVTIGRMFEAMMFGLYALTPTVILKPDHFDEVIQQLGDLKNKCSEIGMQITPDLCQQAIDYLQKNRARINYVLVGSRAGELYRSFSAELVKQRFFRLSADRNKYFVSIDVPLFGDKVEERFPEAVYDINEAGRCLATERDTACVLHLMRVLEVGLQRLAIQFGVPFEHKNWENVIGQIESKINDISKGKNKPANWKEQEEEYAGIAKEFRYLKNAWRNHAMHVRHQYDFGGARSVFTHVDEFMRRLAIDLPKEQAIG